MQPLAPMWDVVEEHLDEAEFLWGAWERSLVSPRYTLDEVAELVEERLHAHLHALALHGGAAARRLLVPALETDTPERVCAAASALLLDQRGKGADAVFEALRELPAQRPALVRALCCAERPDLRPRLRGLLTEFDETIVAAAAEVLAFHFEPIGEAIDVLLAADDPAVRAVGLRALPGEAASPKFVRAVQAALVDDDLTVVDAAIDAGIFLAPTPTWRRVRSRVNEPNCARAMLLLALRGDAEGRAVLVESLQDSSVRAPALVALSYVGSPEIVDASLEWLDEPLFGSLIGEMMSALTGVDLDEAGLARLAGDDEESLEYAPEDELPRPDPMLVIQWWSRQRPLFDDAQRYLSGHPRTLTGLVDTLATGPMRRRPNLYLDLQVQGVRKLSLQPRAPTPRQRAALFEFRRLSTASEA